MAETLHVALRYEIEFAKNNFFNWQRVEVMAILNHFIYYVDESEYHVTIDSEKFKEMIDKIGSMTDEQFLEEIKGVVFYPEDIDRKNLLEGFTSLYESRDERICEIHLFWF